MTNGRGQLRGAGLLAHVYGELRAELGDAFSTEELLQAAEILLRLSKKEYIENDDADTNDRSNYYNYDVFEAFEKISGQIFCKEALDDSWESDCLSRDFATENFLNHLINRHSYG